MGGGVYSAVGLEAALIGGHNSMSETAPNGKATREPSENILVGYTKS